MAGIGFGFGSARGTRLVSPFAAPPSSGAIIGPGASWDGTAGSGFGTNPVDPARVTAKPVCRLLEPPNQAFTTTKWIGVWAAASNSGSLQSHLGLAYVRVHFEGNTRDILQPSYRTFVDANGNAVSYLGWWIQLEHNGTNGAAQVYFEAVPADTAMQNRVMGPYTYLPSTTIHDYQIEVSPSEAEIPGVSYQTIRNALQYLKDQGARHPRLTLIETATYDITNVTGGTYVADGCCKIICAEGETATIGRTAITASSSMRSRYDGLWFEGANIVFDMAHVSEFYCEGFVQHVFSGVTFSHSGGRGALWLGGLRPVGWLVRGNPYFLECSWADLEEVGKSASLVRGGTASVGYGDCVTNALCVVGLTTFDWDSSDYITGIPAFSVEYTGGAGSATLSLSGNNNANNRVFTAKENGTAVSSFTVRRDYADWLAGTNYTVQKVVDWINSLPGWSATFLDGSRRANLCTISTLSGAGAFSDEDVKTAALTVETRAYVHSDWYQSQSTIDAENVVIANNMVYGAKSQLLFVTSDTRDMVVVNNCFDPGDVGEATFFSQLEGDHSHVFVGHNSWSKQELRVRNDGNYSAANCAIAANVCAGLAYASGGTISGLTVADNHFYAGEAAPADATGSTFSGNEVSLFADVANGDFSPAGALLTNKVAPLVERDLNGVERAASDAKGALAI